MLVKEITFTFENCESFTIDGKWIGSFLVSDIERKITRLGCNWIDEVITAHTFAIEIFSGADGKYNPFGIQSEETTKFKRLKQYDDITHIDFTLYDQYGEKDEVKNYHFALYWDNEDDDDWNNEAMTVYQSELGNLYIVVSDKEKFDDFFDKQVINDKNEIDFRCSMLDIGGN